MCTAELVRYYLSNLFGTFCKIFHKSYLLKYSLLYICPTYRAGWIIHEYINFVYYIYIYKTKLAHSNHFAINQNIGEWSKTMHNSQWLKADSRSIHTENKEQILNSEGQGLKLLIKGCDRFSNSLLQCLQLYPLNHVIICELQQEKEKNARPCLL